MPLESLTFLYNSNQGLPEHVKIEISARYSGALPRLRVEAVITRGGGRPCATLMHYNTETMMFEPTQFLEENARKVLSNDYTTYFKEAKIRRESR